MLRRAIALFLATAVAATGDDDTRLGNGYNVVFDRMRSCLDVNGDRFRSDDFGDCTYLTSPAGSFEQRCVATFSGGDASLCPDADTTITRRCDSKETQADWETFFVPDLCLAYPDYLQTLTGNGDGTCTCVETFSTPPLPENCGLIEPDEGGNSGRPGCSDRACSDVVCDIDGYCCGDLDGWWDRICIGYAGVACTGGLGECDYDCDSDADCLGDLLCADDHKRELEHAGFDRRKANCEGDIPDRVEVCFEKELIMS